MMICEELLFYVTYHLDNKPIIIILLLLLLDCGDSKNIRDFRVFRDFDGFKEIKFKGI